MERNIRMDYMVLFVVALRGTVSCKRKGKHSRNIILGYPAFEELFDTFEQCNPLSGRLQCSICGGDHAGWSYWWQPWWSWPPFFTVCPPHSWWTSRYLFCWAKNGTGGQLGTNCGRLVWSRVELKSDSPPSQMLILSRYCYQSRKQWCSRDNSPGLNIFHQHNILKFIKMSMLKFARDEH